MKTKSKQFICLLMILTFVSIGFGELFAASGLVRLDSKSFKDDSGYFIGYGATYFQALRHAIDNDSALASNLSFLNTRYVNFIRVLGMVTHTNTNVWPADRWIEPNETGYWDGFRRLLDNAWAKGIRVQITIFTSTQYFDYMDSITEQKAFIDSLMTEVVNTRDANNVPRAYKIQMFEIANEWFHSTQNFTAAQIKTLTSYLKTKLNAAGYGVIPIAPSRPYTNTKPDIDTIYAPGVPKYATANFSRDTAQVDNGQTGWEPVYDCENIYQVFQTANVGVIPVVSVEPVGPGTSGTSQTNKTRLVMAAEWAWACGLPGYVYHSGAGVGRYPYSAVYPKVFTDAALPGLKLTGKLKNILPTNMANLGDYMPFNVVSGTYVRMKGKYRNNLRWVFIIGANNLVLQSPSERMDIEIYDPENMTRIVNDYILEAGNSIDLSQWSRQAYLIFIRKL